MNSKQINSLLYRVNDRKCFVCRSYQNDLERAALLKKKIIVYYIYLKKNKKICLIRVKTVISGIKRFYNV